MQMPNVLESWSQKQKGSVSGDLVYAQASLGRRSKLSEVKGPVFGDDKLLSEKGIDNIIEEVGYSTMSGNLSLTDSARDVRYNKDSTGEKIAPIMDSPNLFSADDGFNSEFPCPFSDSNCQESSPIDLKLGRLEDYGGSKSFKLFPGSSMGFSAESSRPIKRTRSAGLNSQTFFCQVHGCNKDLSSSKDYHKRHRVCDTHSKTAKVIVKGIEQRFCQQCSRFHLLAEFDEGKRSCRRRLAGHNERRRKPHLGKHCGRSGKFHSYHGGAFNGISFAKTSSICENMVQNNQLQLEKLGDNGWNQRIKVEFQSDYNNLFANGGLLPKNSLPDVNLGKQYPCLREGQANHLLKSVITRDTGDDYLQGMPGLQCRDHSYTVTSCGDQDSNVFCTEPTFNSFSTTMSPSALSLLSSQSQNSPNYSTGIPMTQTSSITGNPAHCSGIPVSDTLLEAIPIVPFNGMSHKLASCGLRSEISNLCPILIPEEKVGVYLEDSELFHGLTADRDRLSCEDELTIDLLQLSSQLQRVERQKQSVYATSRTLL